MDYPHDLIVSIEHGHRDDAVSFHAVNHCAPQLVDVRETTERDAGYIPGSQSVPYRLLRRLGCGALDRSRPVVTVCESGPRAAIAASLLQREGFDVRAVADGGIADFSDTVAFRRCGA